MFFDILSKTFQIFLSTPSLIIYPLVGLAINFIITTVLTSVINSPNLLALIILIPLQFLLTVITFMTTVASCYAVFKQLKGEDISIMEGFSLVIERFGKIASFMGLLFVVVFICLIVLLLITAIPALACLVFIPFIGLIILSFGTMLVPVVIGIEELGGLAAYRRSAQLVNNTKSVVAFIFLFSFVLGFIMLSIMMSSFTGSITPQDIEMIQRTGTYPASFGIFANPFFQFVTSVVTSMFASIFTAVWYTKAVEKVDTPPL